MRKKILSRAELLTERAHLRKAGRRLVFTNGVFDILHIGHVRYLEQARTLGDALIVAINSDRTAGELKGDGRPLINENERAEILAALRSVNYVTIFDDVSPRSLIAQLLPDVLVKGGDYALDEIQRSRWRTFCACQICGKIRLPPRHERAGKNCEKRKKKQGARARTVE